MYPQLKRVEKYSLDNPPAQLKDALSLLDATLPRDRATMQKQFRLLAAAETNSVLQMTLQPNSVSARKFIGQIVIGFQTNDFSIALTEMKFADGSSLRNDFSHVVMNQTIEDSRFELKVPADFTVTEPLHQ
jgi:outer membrane lipoprotein-sorting protein